MNKAALDGMDFKKRKLTRLNIINLCADYENGMRLGLLAGKYNIGSSTVDRILRKCDVKRTNKMYSFKEDFLSLDNLCPKSAYWIGFISSDGHVRKNSAGSGIISLSLKADDAEHLYKLREFAKADYPIHIRDHKSHNKIYKICEIKFTSNKTFKDLKSYGIVGNKHNRRGIKMLEFNKDFWRGVIDADGSLGIDSRSSPWLQIAGPYPIVKQFRSFSLEYVESKAKIIQNNKSKKSYKWQVRGSKLATKLIKLLYNNCSIYLDRKHKRAAEIIKRFSF